MLCRCCVLKVADVVCNELSDDVMYVDVYEFVNEFIYVHWGDSHVKNYGTCTCFWLKPVAMVLFLLKIGASVRRSYHYVGGVVTC